MTEHNTLEENNVHYHFSKFWWNGWKTGLNTSTQDTDDWVHVFKMRGLLTLHAGLCQLIRRWKEFLKWLQIIYPVIIRQKNSGRWEQGTNVVNLTWIGYVTKDSIICQNLEKSVIWHCSIQVLWTRSCMAQVMQVRYHWKEKRLLL